jgi:hypothetical protein
MEVTYDLSGIWLMHLAVLGILDGKLFNKPPEGERKVGNLVWGIAVLAIAGLSVLSDLWDVINLLQYLDMLAYNPVLGLLNILGMALSITLCVFIILGGIARIRNRAPGKAVLKIILGACLGGLGLTQIVASVAMGGMYYY